MQTKPLNELLQDLERSLQCLGYTEGSLKFYRNRWQMLLRLAKERNEVHYSERLGLDFVEKNFHILAKDFDKTLSQKDTQELRIIRMIGDFQLHHTVLRRYYKHKEILSEPHYVKISGAFQKHCETKGYSNVTIDHYVKQSARFMDYLYSQGVFNCREISMILINNYIKTLVGYTYKTVEQNICSLRAFFRFLLENGTLQVDFASKTPMIQARKQTRIPSVWTQEELKRLIEAIDRGSPKGKRDYAIILLACSLGLRCTDIKKLKPENFKWEGKKLEIMQSKTKKPLALPLTPEVGWAVIDYLKYGRPKVDSPYIFVRHMAPFLPFSDGDHLNQLIKGYMGTAHIPTLKKRRGMHSLRHTLASVMLESDTPVSVISDILGHADVNSTAVYLKVDLKKLKECPLDIPEVSTNE